MNLKAYPVVAYNYAFGMLIIIEILFFGWMLLNIRRLENKFLNQNHMLKIKEITIPILPSSPRDNTYVESYN